MSALIHASREGRRVSEIQFWKLLLIINGLIPLALLGWDALQGKTGGNAIGQAIHTTGYVSLLFIMASLAVTPLRVVTGWTTPVAFRRILGLFGFFYAAIHFGIYFGFDRALSLSSTFDEIAKRRFLLVGMTALMLMVPLAVTSTNAMINRLGGKRWKLLHRTAYIVGALAVLHYFMQVKADIRQPLAFAVVLGAFLLMRLPLKKLLQTSKSHSPVHTSVKSPATATGRPRFWTGELKLARVFHETSLVKTFRFVAPDGNNLPFAFEPGQYLTLKVLIDGKFVSRSYTIASSPSQSGYCEISVKREEHGLVSRYLHEHLQEGDLLSISAPGGKFFFNGRQAKSVVFISGGVGITPLMSMTRYLTDTCWPGEIHFLVVDRSPKDLIFYDELRHLAHRFPNLHVAVTLTRSPEMDDWMVPDGWRRGEGRINTSWLRECLHDWPQRQVYLCGPDAMMDATRELLTELGVPAEQIFTEAFVSPAAQKEATEILPVESPANTTATSSRELTTHSATPGEFQATLQSSRQTIELSGYNNLLEAAEAAGLDWPYDCRSGVCGQCRVRLISGEVVMDVHEALTPQERAQGHILPCQARAFSHLVIEA
ncbi:FAD-binding oxidoreductase [Planctopirus limnophila]|uniref:FAD-binding oxidoreductase n=1 Tax=Planctopirus limnophila TaxID=120 RepID=UPI0011D09AAD|nr:FAD-binding oxidoreductase [Planctopirus limnophila]